MAEVKLTYDELVAFENITQRNLDRAVERAINAEFQIEQMKGERQLLLNVLRKAHDFLDRNGNGWDEAELLTDIRERLDDSELASQVRRAGVMVKAKAKAETQSQSISVEWKVHTASLLREILKNPGCSVLAIPLSILGRMLAEVAERAAELNDPQLNILMLRLTLYEQGDPEKFSHEQIEAEYVEQRLRLVAEAST